LPPVSPAKFRIGLSRLGLSREQLADDDVDEDEGWRSKMSTAVVNLSEVALKWRNARRIYPLYSALNRQFDLGVGPCRDLESPINRSEPEVMERIRDWFNQMDNKVQVFQLRQLLQTTHLATEENLHALIARHLEKPEKPVSLRDKVDYLLVQYYAHCAPHDAHNTHIDFDHVAEILHAVLGDVSPLLPSFCDGLDSTLTELDECSSLGDLLQRKIVEKARSIKDEAGEKYFMPSVLVAFTRFNFLLRLGFFRLMHADLHAIRFAIHQMESRGQSTCDCTSADLGEKESLVRLREICHDWKQPFRAAYSGGNSFSHLVKIRAAVEAAMVLPLPVVAEKVVDEPSHIEPEAEQSIAEEIAAAEASLEAPEPVAAVIEQAPPQPEAGKKMPAAAKQAASKAVAQKIDLAAPDLDACLEQIAEQLLVVTGKSASVSTVLMGGTKLLLASWEVAAFVRGGDDVSDALQRAVAARAIVSLAIERKKRGEAADLNPAISLAHAEASQIQERIAEAKDKKNIDAAVNLAATAKRLLGVLDEAEKAR
jgi:hypothetical protein